MKNTTTSKVTKKSKINKQLYNLLFDRKGCIPIEQALKEARERYPHHKPKRKIDSHLTNQIKEGLNNLKSKKIKRVA